MNNTLLLTLNGFFVERVVVHARRYGKELREGRGGLLRLFLHTVVLISEIFLLSGTKVGKNKKIHLSREEVSERGE